MSRSSRRACRLSLLLLALLSPGCALTTPPAAPAHAPRLGRVISAQQIQEWRVHTAWEALQRGATYLALSADPLAGEVSITRRGSPTFRALGEPLVVVDGVRMGGASVLREIPARDVARISVLSAVEATARFGLGSSAGVISVETWS